MHLLLQRSGWLPSRSTSFYARYFIQAKPNNKLERLHRDCSMMTNGVRILILLIKEIT